MSQFSQNTKRPNMTKIKALLLWMFVGISLITAIPVTEQELSINVVDRYVNDTVSVDVDKNDIKIFFYNNENPTHDIQVDLTDVEAIQKTSFSNTKQSFFVIHGWESDVSDLICTTIRDALLTNNDVNVFVVDWSSISKKLYPQAFLQVEPIGKLLATMIRALQSNNGLDLGNTVITGHSLGAHIAGVTGTALNGECDYIVGMDPAGPLFLYEVTSNRISASSAQFVHIIHTCGSELGFYKPLGHADYYPNGGLRQNGCGMDVTGACSHGRSYLYYAESILSGQFVAQKCDSYEVFQKGECDGSKSLMGGFNIDKSARGNYYLDTNDKSPFAK